MAAASAESFCSSSSSGKRTSTPMALGFCALTARISLASSARGHGQRPCCSSVASSINTSATWLETGSGRRRRKKKSFSFWLSVETGKLKLTRHTSASKTTLSLTQRPQVMGFACVELEKNFIAEANAPCWELSRPSNQFLVCELSGTKFSVQCPKHARPWICCPHVPAEHAKCVAAPCLPVTKEEFCPEGHWCGPSGVHVRCPPRRSPRTSRKFP